ncbi:hypothetical protein SAMN05192551_11135 [Tindallia magadiensis]|uniref:Pirin family protein n=1 Tax=Tindallia magadiensis TaxID=69895 RepID=A0A1I3H328_9FIRM|nr:pirin family protein [Tindallia magadiensis]SFI30043.1 hypothetical protein SAMN05192551_11135 [Tindallia magadiensis]
MTALRPIEEKFVIEKEHWVGNGFLVRNYFPGGRNLLQRFSPFALMDYNVPKNFPPSKTSRGIGPHPHRGIETVTFAFEGAVEHHDNAGNHGIIYPGDVQWMTAGGGIMHKEYHEKAFLNRGGIFHMIQLWVNLPKKDKYVPGRYQDLPNTKLGKVELADGAGNVTVVSGEFDGVKGPAMTYSPMNIYWMDLTSGSEILFEEPGDYNTGMMITGGKAEINGADSEHKDFILFENQEGKIQIKAGKSGVKLMVLSGEPLKEPAVAGGPFVMNTQEELDQAFQDYREGNFGTENF